MSAIFTWSKQKEHGGATGKVPSTFVDLLPMYAGFHNADVQRGEGGGEGEVNTTPARFETKRRRA